MSNKKPQTKPQPTIEIAEEKSIPEYLQRIIASKPRGGDGGIVYAGDYGWICEYPYDGSKEVLEELTGLAKAFKEHNLDRFGNPIQPGTVISTNITKQILTLLSTEDIQLLAEPLGIVGERQELISQLIEKLQIK